MNNTESNCDEKRNLMIINWDDKTVHILNSNGYHNNNDNVNDKSKNENHNKNCIKYYDYTNIN